MTQCAFFVCNFVHVLLISRHHLIFLELQLEVIEAPLASEPGGRRGAAAAFKGGGSRGILCLLAVGEGLLAVAKLRGDGLDLCYLAFLDI